MANNGTVRWQSPSNIALIKYWGKYGRQLPRNASISFTLSNCVSDTQVDFEIGSNSNLAVDFTFEGQSNAAFAQRIEKHLESITDHLPWLQNAKLSIASSNSFPHSSGIASSASAMSALAMCLVDIDASLSGNANLDMTLASNLSRLGSGSAARSVIPQLGMWGQHPDFDSCDEYAIAYGDEVNSVFHTYHDDILIVSAGEKSVSSSAGHGLMDASTFATARYQLANDRLTQLIKAMKAGDLEQFGTIVEDEALTLHGLMMCSEPSFVLMEPGTIHLIQEIRAFRKESKLPVYFTLDAGPNIHLLYPDSIATAVAEWRDERLKPHCEKQTIIKDHVGNGPKKIS